MASAKEDLLDIANELVAFENENGLDMKNALHTKLRDALRAHGPALGLTDEDIAEIEAVGPQARALEGTGGKD